MSTTVSIEQLSEEINRELTLYNDNVIEEIKKRAKESMSRLVQETKATAPVGNRQKHYRDSIKSKKTKENNWEVEYTWYVDGPDYRLSHLLENGHALRNGGRAAGTHFIRNASEPILEEYLQAVEEVCQNG